MRLRAMCSVPEQQRSEGSSHPRKRGSAHRVPEAPMCKGHLVRFSLVAFLALAVAAGAAESFCAQQPQEDEVTGGEVVLPRKHKESEKERAGARDPNNPEPTKDIRVRSNLVETPVTVTDSQGESVYDLSEEDFRIFDNGVPQRIQTFEQELRPLAVVILIQSSEAVSPLLGQLSPLASLFSNLLLGPQGQTAVITFDDRVRVAQELSGSGDQLTETLKNLRAEGDKARLNDGLARAIALLERRPKSERRIIIAFSDGFDAGSETGEEDLVRRAMSADVTIYGLGFSRTQALLKMKPQGGAPSPLDAQVTRPVGPGVVPTPTNAQNTYGTPGAGNAVLGAAGALVRSAAGSPVLDFYAGTTGGVFYSHWSEKALQDQISQVASEIHSQYELAYVPDTLSQPGFHRIEVQVRRPGVKVRTRVGYFYTATKH